MLHNGLRSAVLSVGLVFSALASGQSLGSRVDYTTAAIPLSEALAQISELSKTTLSVDGDISSEPVILRFKQVPLSEVMERVAGVVHAEWKPYGKGFLLERTPEMVRKLEDAAITTRSRYLSENVQNELKKIADRGPWTSEKAMQLAEDAKTIAERTDEGSRDTGLLRDALMERLPDFTALWQILAAMNPRDLAAIKPGERVAFSNMPGKMQLRLRQDILSAVPDWQKQHDELAADIKSLSKNGLNPGSIVSDLPETPFTGQPARVTMVVSRPFTASALEVEMLAFDEHGHPISSMRAYPFTGKDEGARSLQDYWKDAPKDEKPFELSAASQQFLRVPPPAPSFTWTTP